jgi:hypothetical protein
MCVLERLHIVTASHGAKRSIELLHPKSSITFTLESPVDYDGDYHRPLADNRRSPDKDFDQHLPLQFFAAILISHFDLQGDMLNGTNCLIGREYSDS